MVADFTNLPEEAYLQIIKDSGHTLAMCATNLICCAEDSMPGPKWSDSAAQKQKKRVQKKNQPIHFTLKNPCKSNTTTYFSSIFQIIPGLYEEKPHGPFFEKFKPKNRP